MSGAKAKEDKIDGDSAVIVPARPRPGCEYGVVVDGPRVDFAQVCLRLMIPSAMWSAAWKCLRAGSQKGFVTSYRLRKMMTIVITERIRAEAETRGCNLGVIIPHFDHKFFNGNVLRMTDGARTILVEVIVEDDQAAAFNVLLDGDSGRLDLDFRIDGVIFGAVLERTAQAAVQVAAKQAEIEAVAAKLAAHAAADQEEAAAQTVAQAAVQAAAAHVEIEAVAAKLAAQTAADQEEAAAQVVAQVTVEAVPKQQTEIVAAAAVKVSVQSTVEVAASQTEMMRPVQRRLWRVFWPRRRRRWRLYRQGDAKEQDSSMCIAKEGTDKN